MARNDDAALALGVLEHVMPTAGSAFPAVTRQGGHNLRPVRFQRRHMRKYMRNRGMTPWSRYGKLDVLRLWERAPSR
jgi:hypothetical protein